MRARRLPAAVLLAPLFGLLLAFYLTRQFGYPSYYGLAQIAHAGSSVAVLAPLCAAIAAWEASRLRRGKVSSLAPVRNECSIAWRELRWVFLVGAGTLVGAIAIELRTGPSIAPSDFLLLLVSASVLISHSLAGYAVGRNIPAVFAVPSVLIGSWFWLVYPNSIEPLWVRHLTGYFSLCCNIDSVPATGAYVAPILISMGIGAASLLALAMQLGQARLILSLAVLGAAIAGAVPLVSGFGAQAVKPRPASELTCVGSQPKTCVWPENKSALSLVAATAHALASHLRAAGLRVPPVVSEAVGVPNTWPIGVSLGVTHTQVVASLLEDLLPPMPTTCDARHPYYGDRSQPAVLLWLTRHSGADPKMWTTTKSARDEVRQVDRSPQPSQLKWLAANLNALGSCGIKPPSRVP